MKLLIVEDEKSLLQSMIDFFKKESFVCEWAGNFNDALEKISLFEYDCIILDINLPGGSGLQVLDELRLRKKQDGVVIISARNSVDDRIEGLESGADDYLVKPFHLTELSARVKALIRRKYANGTQILNVNNLAIDLKNKEVKVGGQLLTLTRHEYDLLFFMVGNKGRVVSRQAIAEHLSGDQVDQLDSYDFVYSHIRNLKKKLGEKGLTDCIKAVYGFGYKYEEE
jgi:DNA-binding response OmpR family regulator